MTVARLLYSVFMGNSSPISRRHGDIRASLQEAPRLPEGGNVLHVDVDLEPLGRLQDDPRQLQDRNVAF